MARSLNLRFTRLVATLGVFMRVAAAEDMPTAPTTVNLVAPACIERPYDRSRLLESMRIELGALGVKDVEIAPTSAPDDAPGVVARVVLAPETCDPTTVDVTIQVIDHASRKLVARRMTLSDVAVADRPRVLAIAVAELLQASFVELMLVGAPLAEVEIPSQTRNALMARIPADPSAVRVAAAQGTDAKLTAWSVGRAHAEQLQRVRNQAPSLEIAAVTETFPSRNTALLGGEVAGTIRASDLILLHASGGAAAGDSRVAAGSVTVADVNFAGGIGFTTGGTIELEIGPWIRAGYAVGTGSTTDSVVRSRSYGNAVSMALLCATLRVHSPSPWSALVGVEIGYTLEELSLLSDASRAAGIGGAVVGLRIGVGVGL